MLISFADMNGSERREYMRLTTRRERTLYSAKLYAQRARWGFVKPAALTAEYEAYARRLLAAAAGA